MKEPIPKRPDWHSRRCSLGSPFTFRQGARLNQITSFTVLYWHANHKSGRFPYLGRCRISLAQCARMTRCQSARRDRRPCQQHIGVGLCIKGCLGFIDPPGMVSLYGELPRIPVLNACSPLVTFWLARSGPFMARWLSIAFGLIIPWEVCRLISARQSLIDVHRLDRCLWSAISTRHLSGIRHWVHPVHRPAHHIKHVRRRQSSHRVGSQPPTSWGASGPCQKSRCRRTWYGMQRL